MYQAGYSDELYFDGSARESNAYQQKESRDDRKIVTTDMYTNHNDYNDVTEEEYYDNEYSGIHIFRSHCGTRILWHKLSFLGGWYYPYYGPYARYRWVDWYWDAYFYSPYYAVCGIHIGTILGMVVVCRLVSSLVCTVSLSLLGISLLGLPLGLLVTQLSDYRRETITHRNSLVTNRPNSRGTSIRQGGTLKEMRQAKIFRLCKVAIVPTIQSGIRSTRPDNRLESDERNNQVVVRDVRQTTSDRDGVS